MTEPLGSGAPDFDAVIVAHEAERARLHEAMMVSEAEGTVAAPGTPISPPGSRHRRVPQSAPLMAR